MALHETCGQEEDFSRKGARAAALLRVFFAPLREKQFLSSNACVSPIGLIKVTSHADDYGDL